MQGQLESLGSLPITMATSHGAAAKDDALSTVARITKVSLLPDFSATFEADIADTAAGRDMATLVDPENPFVRGVSIRGRWLGDLTTEDTDDGVVTSAPDLEIMGIDFTSRPGVTGAQITSAHIGESLGESADPRLICESVEDVGSDIFIDETGEPAESISEVADSETDSLDRLHELRESLDTIIAEKDAKAPEKQREGAYSLLESALESAELSGPDARLLRLVKEGKVTGHPMINGTCLTCKT